EIFNLRFRNAMRQLDNPLRIRFLRRDVARYTTALAEHRQGIRFLATGEAMPPTGETATPKAKPKAAVKTETKPAKTAEAKAAAEDVSATSAKTSEKPKRRVPWSRGKKKE
ncbi:MAG TPA: 50S ribosomal protein L29, partial [Candidatus Eisenbacteria bacterium]|nr:50S ribosomal protein L29 [Candidatus Eisenbacteria bacterium]